MRVKSEAQAACWAPLAIPLVVTGLLIAQTASAVTCSVRTGGEDKPLIVEEWAWGHDIREMDPHPTKEEPTIRLTGEPAPVYFWFRVSGCDNHLSEMAEAGGLDLEVQWESETLGVWIPRPRRTPASVTRYRSDGSDKIEGFRVELRTRQFFDVRTNTNLGEDTLPRFARWKLTIFHDGQAIETADGQREFVMRVAP